MFKYGMRYQTIRHAQQEAWTHRRYTGALRGAWLFTQPSVQIEKQNPTLVALCAVSMAYVATPETLKRILTTGEF